MTAGKCAHHEGSRPKVDCAAEHDERRERCVHHSHDHGEQLPSSVELLRSVRPTYDMRVFDGCKRFSNV
jgi:hypothetical protein